MDNLTHTLVGLMIARAGLNRLGPRSTALLIVGANLPDADVVSAFSGGLAYLDCHRGWSHAFAISPLLALLPLPLWWLFARKERPGFKAFLCAFLAAFAGVLSHLFLDCWNTYGVRLLMPWSGEWYRLDWVYIVDLWIWALLLVGVLGPFLVRMVNSEIGVARRKQGRSGAWIVLILLGALLTTRAVLHAQAVATLETRMYDSRRPIRAIALPGPFAPWKWTGVVETDRAWSVVPVDLLRDFDPDAGRTLLKPEAPLPQEQAIRASRTGRVFLNFARYPYWHATPSPRFDGGTVVTVTDLRFGLPEESRFSATFEFDGAGRLVDENFSMSGSGRGR
jgi:inner membrane protein